MVLRANAVNPLWVSYRLPVALRRPGFPRKEKDRARPRAAPPGPARSRPRTRSRPPAPAPVYACVCLKKGFSDSYSEKGFSQEKGFSR
jgi:hypothetical protein